MARLLEELRDYMKVQLSVPFIYGQSDCSTWVASWIEHMTDVDPAASFRGCYTNEIGCAKFVKTNGGLIAAMDHYMIRSGVMYHADVPFHGDVAIVVVPIGNNDQVEVAAVRTRNGWAYKPATGGLQVLNRELTVLGLWRMRPSCFIRNSTGRIAA